MNECRAGELRHRITFRRRTTGDQNSFGENVGDPSTVGTFSARIETRGGKETFAQQQIWAEANYRITIRYQPGIKITPAMYIEYGSSTFDILSAQDVNERHEWIVIFARDHVE